MAEICCLHACIELPLTQPSFPNMRERARAGELGPCNRVHNQLVPHSAEKKKIRFVSPLTYHQTPNDHDKWSWNKETLRSVIMKKKNARSTNRQLKKNRGSWTCRPAVVELQLQRRVGWKIEETRVHCYSVYCITAAVLK
jgi:hypothetical protein